MSDPSPDQERKTEFNYPLKSSFKYSHGGGQTDASFIQLSAPTSKHTKECAALKQAFFRALPKNQDVKEETDEDIEGSDVIILIAMSIDVDLSDVLENARRLFSSGLALVEGETKLTNHLIDCMSMDDLENMTGEFMVNFTLASSLAQMRAKSSKA